MRSKWKIILIATIVVVGVSQFIPINRSNPPIKAPFSGSQELMSILKRSCYDCHSNETVWPWYSHVAPISWLVAYDVFEGREHLNFSNWGRYDSRKQTKQKEEIWEAVSEGEMPPFQYYPAHPDARLSDRDKQVLRSWTSGSIYD